MNAFHLPINDHIFFVLLACQIFPRVHLALRWYGKARSFAKKDGMPDVEFEGYTCFNFPMDHHEFIESGVIGNPLRATKEKGEEVFRRLSEHVAGVLELMKVPVEVHTRAFADRVM